MKTVRDFVTEAYWIAGIVALGREPRSAELNYGIQVFNDMLAAWAADGIDLEQGELADSDTPDFADAYSKGVKYNLAVELASGPFQAALTDGVIGTATDQKRVIRNALFTIDDLDFDDAPITMTTNSPYY